MFSLVEELSSPAFRKIAALVSPKRGYPELPDYPTIPALPICITSPHYLEPVPFQTVLCAFGYLLTCC